MNCSEFTDDEIREELIQLGYHNVPQDKLEDFKRDLMKLISTERSKTNSLNSSRSTEPEVKHRHAQQEELEVEDIECDENANFSNHKNHNHGKQYREDWCYQGKNENQSHAQEAQPMSTQLYDVQRMNRMNAHFENRPVVCGTKKKSRSCHQDIISDDGCENKSMKRKTSRKTADGCRKVDESFTDSESGVFEIYERIKNLAMRECRCGTQGKSGDVEPPYRIKGKVNKYPSGKKKSSSSTNNLIKKLEPPHTRNLVRTNAYERHRMYKEGWKSRPPIGEDDRFALRKAIHTQMLQFDSIRMKEKVYVPNLYVPPHEKSRKDVRWQVRQAFEKYEMPQHGHYHDT